MTLIPEMSRSLRRALARDGWLFGKRFNQYGNPFLWVDGPLHISAETSQAQHLAGWASSYYDWFEPLKILRGTRYDELLGLFQTEFSALLDRLLPPNVFSKSDLERYVRGLAVARAQDVRILEIFAPDLDLSSMRHLDFGPGMGVHSVWNSVLGKELSCYTAIEIDEQNFALQRTVFAVLSEKIAGRYFDSLAAEELLAGSDILNHVNSDQMRFVHVPSWNFCFVQEKSQDLVTATTVLNEIGYSAIGYFVTEMNRVLRVGGHLYVRDSGRAKPGRHDVNYESYLRGVGFERADDLTVEHRVTMHGVPRLWRKMEHHDLAFEDVMDSFVGADAVVVHGGDYVHSVKSDLTSMKRQDCL